MGNQQSQPLIPSPVNTSANSSAVPAPVISPPTQTDKHSPDPTSTIHPEDDLNHPGAYEDLHKKVKDLQPLIFDGAKLSINKPLSSHFQCSHTLTMSNMMSGYKFGVTYAGLKMLSAREAFPVMVAEIDFQGNLNSQIIHQLSDKIRGRFIAQGQKGKWVGMQSTLDYKAPSYTTSLTISNPDVINRQGIMVLQCLKRVTPWFDLGAELFVQKDPMVRTNRFNTFSMVNVAGRYIGEHWQAQLALSPSTGGGHASTFYRLMENPDESLTVGAEVEASLPSREANVTGCFQYELHPMNLLVRGQVDSKFKVGSVIEKKLPPLPFTLLLSAYADQLRGQFTFGIGLALGGP